jgi:crotonobetainyl-CoA:carnitine CoA-transferase CaiB-like acyl-CoA transferase
MLLRGVVLIDLSRLLPGAYCAQLLRQQGAQVIKIEPPAGDPMRRMPGGQAIFDALHQGSELIRLDLRNPDGRAALQERLRHTDVLLEGFRPGRMDSFGLGYDALVAINPRLVYCAITGYGSQGALAGRAGHDLNYLARSGALSLMPACNGLPVIPGLQVADMAGGLQAAFLMVSALQQRATTGRGTRVEVSMTAVMKAWTVPARAARREGAPIPLSGEAPCYRVYRVADGWISVAALEPKFWANLCEAIERPDLVSRQFDPAALRELEPIFLSAPRAKWMEQFSGRDVCVEPVLSLEESEEN